LAADRLTTLTVRALVRGLDLKGFDPTSYQDWGRLLRWQHEIEREDGLRALECRHRHLLAMLPQLGTDQARNKCWRLALDTQGLIERLLLPWLADGSGRGGAEAELHVTYEEAYGKASDPKTKERIRKGVQALEELNKESRQAATRPTPRKRKRPRTPQERAQQEPPR
jgi:hypothetical protein